jgi:putative MATE family efflux protein
MSKLMIDKSKLPFDSKYLRSLILPLVADTALSVAVGMADTLMVAQAGEAAVSGVSCVNTIQTLLVQVIMAFATGGSVVACQLLGMGEKERARKSCKQLMNLVLAFSIVTAGLLLIFRNETIDFIYGTIEDDVFDSAVAYAIPILISMPFYAVMSAANAVSRSMGRSRITMNVSIIVNVVNIAGNAVFLFIFNQGALGVGIASCISRIVGAAIMFVVICDKTKELYIESPQKPEFDAQISKMILSQAVPTGTQNCLFQVGKVLIASTIASFGTASIAAYAVFNNSETLIDIPGTAISLASVTVIGQCCGAKLYEEAMYYARRLIRISTVCMFCTGTVMFLVAPWMVSLYGLSAEATNLAVMTMRVDCVCRLYWSLAFVTPNILQAAGDVKIVMITAILDMWICRVLFAHILGVNLGLGLLGTQMGMWLDWVVRVAVFYPRLRSGKWKTKGIRLRDDVAENTN